MPSTGTPLWSCVVTSGTPAVVWRHVLSVLHQFPPLEKNSTLSSHYLAHQVSCPKLKKVQSMKVRAFKKYCSDLFFFYFFIFFPFDKINKHIDLSKIQVRALWHIYKQYKLQIMCLQIHLTIQCSKKNKHKATILSKVCNLNRKSRPTTPKANRPQVSNL